MIGLLHGYLLEGSGSNLWTRAVIQALCRQGETVHLFCQENHPEQYDFVAQAFVYAEDGSAQLVLDRPVSFPGRCVLHRPHIGNTLPVYVPDRYEAFSRVVPMIDLPDDEIEYYLSCNVRIVTKVVQEMGIPVLHANHAVLMSVVAHRVSSQLSLPFTIMPHGSAIEYAVRKDQRFHRLAEAAFAEARYIFVIGQEIRNRVAAVFPNLKVNSKMISLNLGVDTELFAALSPKRRKRSIRKLTDSLQGLQRGRSLQDTEAFLATLRDDMQPTELQEALRRLSRFEVKLPDADLEQRLRGIDWSRDPLLLFVGRLISSKGLQAVVTALPLILSGYPRAHLIVVGHGPQRDVLEAFLWALGIGKKRLLMTIARSGQILDETGEESWAEVLTFFEQLEAKGKLNDYLLQARNLTRDSVIFTGYLTHSELRHLFPCCDAAVFPSVVAEAGPLVFLEALSSGCFPIGTYFAGMAASIDSLSEFLPPSVAALMKLSTDPEQTVVEIGERVSAVLALQGQYRQTLRQVAVEKYDWQGVTGIFKNTLDSCSQESRNLA